MTAMQAPARPVEPSGERFALSIPRPREIPPRDGLERLARVLAKPVWTREDRDRMKRAVDGIWEHTAIRLNDCGEDCPRCAIAERIQAEIKEWDRIDQAPPIPSTARIRNTLRRPDRRVRALALKVRLRNLHSERSAIVRATVKPFKTPSVRCRREREAEAADPVLRRIDRAARRLERIERDIRERGPWG